MEKKVDRRILKTKSQLRTGLAKLMQSKDISRITVKELVDEVGINRSTFYLHYKDISGLLEEIEREMAEEIQEAIQRHPIGQEQHATFYFIEDLYEVLTKNREISRALVGPNGDIRFIQKIQHIIEENSRGLLTEVCHASEKELRYFYAFCLNGCLGLVKTWLLEGAHRDPEFMARMTFEMAANAMNAFCNAEDSFENSLTEKSQ